MTEDDLTPLEKRFLAMLDSYCALLPDREHIGGSRDDIEYALLFLSDEKLYELIKGISDISYEFLHVAQEAISGGLRKSWCSGAADAAYKVQEFNDIVADAFRARIH